MKLKPPGGRLDRKRNNGRLEKKLERSEWRGDLMELIFSEVEKII